MNSTLFHSLRSLSARPEGSNGFTFLVDGESEEAQLSYRDLDIRAREIARELQRLDCVDKPVALFFQPGLEYIAAFFGCIYARAIAVPAYPPGSRRMLPRIQGIVKDSGCRHALCTSQIRDRSFTLFGEGGGLESVNWICTDKLESRGECWKELEISPSDLAFLQYTSGSTGSPKGVMVTHGNLMANQAMIRDAFRHDRDTVVAGWLPPYHDMGLIGNILQPLYLGVPCILMSPAHAIQKPLRWLAAISKYRATTSGAPNFFYDLCVDKIEESATASLDLQHWSVAFNGAEPVRVGTMRRFAERFANNGFRIGSFLPCYGLAEATLMVSTRDCDGPLVRGEFDRIRLAEGNAVEATDSDESTLLAGSGVAASNSKMIVVDEESLCPQGDGELGEIWVKGEHVAAGYWHNDTDTAETFLAYTSEGEGPFLRTGDLGFLKQGELFVAGRIKDLVVLRGKNFYPQDIEHASENAHESLRTAGAAAFSIDEGGEERLVVLQELEYRKRPDIDEVVSRIRAAVQKEIGASVYAVGLLKPGALPKTSSGKIQRRESKSRYLSGAFAYVNSPYEEGKSDHCAASADDEKTKPRIQILEELWMRCLKVDSVSPSDDFFEQGGDSLSGMQLLGEIEQSLQVSIDIDALFDNSSFGALCVSVLKESEAKPAEPEVEAVAELKGNDDWFPLKASQRQIWFFEKLIGGSALYTIPAQIKIDGPLNLKALERALLSIVEGHDALRARFAIVEGEPRQRFENEIELEISFVDLESSKDSAAEAARRVKAEALKPFDLENELPIRIGLLRIGESKHILTISIHHIVADGWALGLLLEEFVARYESLVQGKEDNFPVPRLPFSHFVMEEGAARTTDRYARGLDFWKETLNDAPVSLNFPYAKERSRVQTYEGSRLDFSLPNELRQKASTAARQQGVTLYMYLLTVFKTLLHRHTNETDLVVGTPIAGRQKPGSDRVIGLFINSLALRTRIEEGDRFSALLDRIRKTCSNAYARQDIAFEDVLERLKIERNLSHSPVFQVLFQLQKAPIAELKLGDAIAQPQETDSETVKLDLVFNVVEMDHGLQCSIRYNRDLFTTRQIERLKGHFAQLLQAAIESPDAMIGELEMLSEAEKELQLNEWNATQKDYGRQAVLTEQFQEQVRKTPERVALVAGETELSYGELDQRSNQLARFLRIRGVTTGNYVGVAMERSWEMVTALLAIQKAGAAYVPMDPEYPEERLRAICEDLSSPILLTQAKFLDILRTTGSGELLAIDSLWDSQISRESQAPLDLPLSGDDIAYVIYTSGSTGKPKGAANYHKSICNRLNWMQDAYPLDGSDVVLQKTPYSFDVSVWEFFWPLLYGAKLVMAEPGGHRDPQYIARIIEEQSVTTLHFVPSMLKLFTLEKGIEKHCGSLRRVISSGEALPGNLATEFSQRFGVPLHNLYGPTEAAVDVTHHTFRIGENDTIVPIGRPIANTSIHILNRELQPTPVGVPGELFIGGLNVGSGYVNREELTRERFIKDPFSESPNAKLYRTGDLCRYREDGTIEYIERLDFQVKLRGFRIELGEIEAAISEATESDGVAVVLVKDPNGDDTLCAYLGGCEEFDVSEVRNSLKKRLPEYMVPSSFVRLPRLPLSANGKLDRKALPAPTQTIVETVKREYIAPQGALQLFLVEQWERATGKTGIGVEDHFFESGGNSIQGAVLINRIQERIGEIVHVVAIFDHPTVSQLSAFLEEAYPDALSRSFGIGRLGEGSSLGRRLVSADIEDFRLTLPNLPNRTSQEKESKNRRAVFVLSPPRSGSTLLRVMLGGHPKLFAPPELELLGFNSLKDRKAAFSGRDSFSLEGTIRALMELDKIDAEQASRLMGTFEDRDFSVKAFYRELQNRLGDRLLVDKTPSYPLDLDTLKRAEEDFEAPLYIHLVRHPLAMVRSFDEARLEQVFCRYEHNYERKQLAELIWLVCQQNIQSFLQGVPSHRQLKIRFEDLVHAPDETMEYLCRFLGLDVCSEMLDPYSVGQNRMTDGLHKSSRMLGDVKFHKHRSISGTVTDKWKESLRIEQLAEESIHMAESLGYTMHEEIAETKTRNSIRSGSIIPRREGHFSTAPMSLSQERLWFLSQLNPESPAYNVPGTVLLDGDVDVELIEDALNQLIKRHETLRYRFGKDEKGKARIEILDTWDLHLEVNDSLYRKSSRDSLDATLVAAARIPFDLSAGPLLRADLYRISNTQSALLVTMHHLIADGWALKVLTDELSQIVSSLSRGESVNLKPLPIQFSDFSAWQRNRLDGALMERQLKYWESHLGANLPTLNLPSDHERPAISSYEGRHLKTRIDSEKTKKVKAMANSIGSTPFAVLMAAYTVFLWRITGQKEFVVGTPVANRSLGELEPLIGCFMNTLPLRSELASKQTFVGLVAQIGTRAKEAFLNQDVPFEKIVERLNPERKMNVTPIFQTLFSLQNVQRSKIDLGNAQAEEIPLDLCISKFDLSLNLMQENDAFVGHFEYSTDLFELERVQHFERIWNETLSTLLNDGNRAIFKIWESLSEAKSAGHCPWLSESSIDLESFNDTEAEIPNASVSELISQSTERLGSKIAITSRERDLTFDALESMSCRFANRLLNSEGLCTEAIVGVLVSRRVELFPCLLGILKAGAAYLPIDPSYPKERIEFMLRDSGCQVLVSDSPIASQLEFDGQIVSLDSTTFEGEDERGSHCVGPEQLAYLIYTSGSTGQPKGVMLTHSNVVNFMVGMRDAVSLREEERILSSTTICFDIFVLESLVPLMLGMSIALVGESMQKDPRSVLSFIKEKSVSLIQATPSLMKALATANGAPESMQSVSKFLVGGEAFPASLYETLKSCGDAEIFNVYGPTETTVWSSVAKLEGGVVHIGRPIANTQMYLLNESGTFIDEVNEVGELCIGGFGLARGYHNRIELTAERFIDCEQCGGEKLYKTGDLARWNENGQLECLGRIDGQVKIRGHRIEVGEIEAELEKVENVEQAVVVAREFRGQNNLIAYLRCSEDVNATRLRTSLSRRLPAYMLPAHYEFLDTIPHTANGKVDRKALPQPSRQAAHVEVRTDGAEFETETQKKVFEIWSGVLGLNQLGVDDNFFDLGGNSLLIVEIQSRLETAFEREISVAEVFSRPSIRTLSAYFDEEDESVEAVGAAISRAERRKQSSRTNRGRGNNTLRRG